MKVQRTKIGKCRHCGDTGFIVAHGWDSKCYMRWFRAKNRDPDKARKPRTLQTPAKCSSGDNRDVYAKGLCHLC
jgi:hypothetical protein